MVDDGGGLRRRTRDGKRWEENEQKTKERGKGFEVSSRTREAFRCKEMSSYSFGKCVDLKHSKKRK